MAQLDFTLSAGPTVATARTLAALGSPITYHYDPDFLALFRETERKVAELFRTKNDVILMQGEAIVGLEGAARSLVRPGMHVLNLVQGVFGKGMGYWLTDFGAVLHEIEVPYDQAVAPESVEQYLDAHPEIELVTLVASETPSGTVTDVSRIGPICRARGAHPCRHSVWHRRHAVSDRRLGARCLCRGCPEVPRGPARDRAGHC
jgi:pyridoxamine--pyruvate transaminase